MLIDEIIELLSNEKSSLTEALLKTKVLLHKIGKKELVDWVNKELNGYADNDDLPSYRVVSSHVLANVSNMAWRYPSHPIPIWHLDEKMRDYLEHAKMRNSLAVLENTVKGQGQLIRHVPMELNGVLGKKLDSSFNVERAWVEINKHGVEDIFAQVRSRLLDFVLELKNEVGESSEALKMKEESGEFNANSAFNSAVFGNNTTVIIGHHGTQNVTSNISKNDLDGLIAALSQLGVPNDEIDNLKAAVEEDKKTSGAANLDGKTGSWLKNLTSRAMKGSLNVSVDIVSRAVTKMLAAFLGYPPT